MDSDKRPVPGLELAATAHCLSDLLLAAPPEWLDKPMLRYRDETGWKSLNRIRVQQAVLRVAAWLESKGIKPGDRVGILGHNCPEWFIADFAILRLGAVSVPAYFTDPPEAVQYIFDNAGVAVAIVEEGEQLHKLDGTEIVSLPFHGDDESVQAIAADESWDHRLEACCPDKDQLATLIYTSGTTGHPKGVMLTHENMLADVAAGIGGVAVFPDDLFLSFLPASHAFERCVGHFLPTACGSEIAYAESVNTLMRDMPEVKPTIMISVPRLYEKIYAGVQAKVAEAPRIKQKLFDLAQRLGIERFELSQQGCSPGGFKALLWRLLDGVVNAPIRQKMGGRIRGFISGGSALHPDIARFLLAADLVVLPGYGLTESSPVLSVNRYGGIKPATVGPALPGVELRVAEDGELLARGAMVMKGYWNDPQATAAVLQEDGWLHTGDLVEIDDDGYVTIVDRKKELIVLSTGENVPPSVVEQHLLQDPCIAQVMVVGDDRPWIVALVVAEEAALRQMWKREKRGELPDDWRNNHDIAKWLLARMQQDESDLASFMQVRRFIFVDGPWTQDEGSLTPTLKLKRRVLAKRYSDEIESLYS